MDDVVTLAINNRLERLKSQLQVSDQKSRWFYHEYSCPGYAIVGRHSWSRRAKLNDKPDKVEGACNRCGMTLEIHNL